MTTHTVHQLTVGSSTVAWLPVGETSPTPLVFLHGLGDSSIMSMWPIARELALEGASSVLIDLPGFGYSDVIDAWTASMEDHANVIARAFEALDLYNVTIVGHSMGGSLALMLASRIQNRVSSLLLAEPLLVREQSILARAIAKRSEEDFVVRGHAMLIRATRRQAARGERGAQGFLDPLMRANPRVLHRSAVSLLADRTPTFEDLLRDSPVPRALLIGARTEADLSVVPDDVPVCTIPDAGHAMMHENPRAFVDEISSWIRERQSIE